MVSTREEWTYLLTTSDDMEAVFLIEILREHGIVVLKKEKWVNIKALFGPNIPQELYVPTTQLPKAKAILEELRET